MQERQMVSNILTSKRILYKGRPYFRLNPQELSVLIGKLFNNDYEDIKYTQNKSIFLTTPARSGTHWLKKILADVLLLEVELPNHEKYGGAHENVPYINDIFDKETQSPGGFIYTGHIYI